MKIMNNIAGFRKLFEVHFTPLVKYAYSITENKEQSKDIVQGFFVQLWHKYPIEEFDNFEAFAFISVRNKCLGWLKTQKRFVGEIPETYDVNSQPHIQEDLYPKYLLESAIRNLPGRCREIFILSKMDGLTYPEIADVLHISIKTVERQIGIGLSKLRETLAPHRELFTGHQSEK